MSINSFKAVSIIFSIFIITTILTGCANDKSHITIDTLHKADSIVVAYVKDNKLQDNEGCKLSLCEDGGGKILAALNINNPSETKYSYSFAYVVKQGTYAICKEECTLLSRHLRDTLSTTATAETLFSFKVPMGKLVNLGTIKITTKGQNGPFSYESYESQNAINQLKLNYPNIYNEYIEKYIFIPLIR
ncbi:MAG: hypothetical protein L3V56_14330 [Candidatus Magnetoovum sp. WYHC-5]|nr:hypothetical protein [Candidatus Magnetoovum sp. WYHC-5]